jgi:hypothetical protein
MVHGKTVVREPDVGEIVIKNLSVVNPGVIKLRTSSTVRYIPSIFFANEHVTELILKKQKIPAASPDSFKTRDEFLRFNSKAAAFGFYKRLLFFGHCVIDGELPLKDLIGDLRNLCSKHNVQSPEVTHRRNYYIDDETKTMHWVFNTNTLGFGILGKHYDFEDEDRHIGWTYLGEITL